MKKHGIEWVRIGEFDWALVFDLAGNYIDLGVWNISHPKSVNFFPIISR